MSFCFVLFCFFTGWWQLSHPFSRELSPHSPRQKIHSDKEHLMVWGFCQVILIRRHLEVIRNLMMDKTKGKNMNWKAIDDNIQHKRRDKHWERDEREICREPSVVSVCLWASCLCRVEFLHVLCSLNRAFLLLWPPNIELTSSPIQKHFLATGFNCHQITFRRINILAIQNHMHLP